MDPNEIIKAAPEIAKGAGALAAAIPFTGIVKRMLGPAADEVAEIWRDQVRVYRYGRQLKLLEKAEKMARDAGFTPQAVPPKILFPLLEGASFEDNEELHTMWAALLANASSPDNAEIVRPGFMAILQQMAPDEAALLNWISGELGGGRDGELDRGALMRAYAELGFGARDYLHDTPSQMKESMTSVERFEACRDGLMAAQLIKSERKADVNVYSLASRGYLFMKACRPPKPKG
jgi:hypothetical protein